MSQSEVPRLVLVDSPESVERIDHWEDLANCKDADTDLFFPDKHEDTRPAKRICADCVVREQCLTDNLDVKIGIYGGMSERQRRAERRRRRGL